MNQPTVETLKLISQNEEHLSWATARWNEEVKHRPMRNVHRRTLDDVWRQVIRRVGGDPDALVGPDHDTLVGQQPEEQDSLAAVAEHARRDADAPLPTRAEHLPGEKLYAKRNPEAQGAYYVAHVSAMTGEQLHRKSAIAAELAHRDIELDTLKAQLSATGALPLTAEAINHIADSMPGGLEGFARGWGWQQFARAVLAAAAPRHPEEGSPLVHPGNGVPREAFDTARLDWLEQQANGFYNVDRVSAVLGSGFFIRPRPQQKPTLHPTLRSAIDAYMAAQAGQ